MPVHSFAETLLSIFGNEPRLIILRNQIVEIVICFENDLATAAAVPAIGPAFRTILLATEGNTTFSAVPAAGINFYFVNEH